ncbi:peptidyl-prolyl cis-trans isomerase FKBP2 isoform X1 [Grus americana]|uniref:peptidyl-prolyl cis-trans isomerase FKBP2 isoform X1 n=1 Tax=Grus americana TaxID=9117 RepID=UPI00240888CC|nr:peptidyl-prolyl cis-trans isomerase FKBP2 isoform X1 [Grus americana]
MAAELWGWVLALALALAAEPGRKVQIGVRRRPEACGVRSRRGDLLHMHYTGHLEDGSQFDSSLSRDQPFVFSLGTGQVIKGWDQGLLGLRGPRGPPKNPRGGRAHLRGGAAEDRAAAGALRGGSPPSPPKSRGVSSPPKNHQ